MDSARDASASTLVFRREGANLTPERDTLAAEEPLEIRIRFGEGSSGAERLLVTMRTPGDDSDLVTGLLFDEGVVCSGAEILSVEPPRDPRIQAELSRNVAIVTLAGPPRELPHRATVRTSACGVCGRTSVEEVLRATSAPGSGREIRISPNGLTELPARLGARQSVFTKTGGLHAAGLFESDGTLVLSREDVGRHNAVDKVIGACLRAGREVPPILLVSGRAGFEIVEKAVRAGVALVASVSAPSSLAVRLAEESGLTLVGFLRGERFNVYAHPRRIVPSV